MHCDIYLIPNEHNTITQIFFKVLHRIKDIGPQQNHLSWETLKS